MGLMTCLRVALMRSRLKSLDRQARCIIEARNGALLRLMEIRHEQDLVESKIAHESRLAQIS